MDGELRSFEAEGAGDDVAAARQEALQSLRELAGELAEDDVEFVTVSEGDRGLMGVGRQPARVLARAQVTAVELGPVGRSACGTSWSASRRPSIRSSRSRSPSTAHVWLPSPAGVTPHV